MKTPIIFLDMDGVMNPFEAYLETILKKLA